jgi:alkylation response protein AidB-like acyl-CoA dehydrogenase
VDFAFTEEQEAVRDLAQQIFADHADHERLVSLESSDDRMDRDLWRALAEANLLGASLPEAYGGSDMGTMEIALLLEEQGRAAVPIPLLATLVLGAQPIARFGTDAQKKAFLPGVIAGEVILSGAFSEAAAVDPLKPRLSAEQKDGSWVLDGEKICVPAAQLATRILVPARTGPDSLGVFLVDPSAEGVTLESVDTTNHEGQANLALASVTVGADDVLGDPQHGDEVITWTHERALAGLCALQIGVAAEALRRTAEYTGVRKQFGKPIGAFQGVSLRAADSYIDLEAMRSTLLQAVWRLDAGQPAATDVGIAKWWACRGGQRIVHTAQHLHGGIGADIDYPIHRFFLWSKQLDLTLGGAAPQLARLGRLLTSDAA